MPEIYQYQTDETLIGKCNDNAVKKGFNILTSIVSKVFKPASLTSNITCDGQGKNIIIYHDSRSLLTTEKNLLKIIIVLIIVFILIKILK